MTDLVLARTSIPNAEDLVRRYLGLPWSGGNDETWAWRYYDTIPDAQPQCIGPIDVLAATALGSGPSPADLVWFWRNRDLLDGVLATLPLEAELHLESQEVVDQVKELPRLLETSPAVTLSLLSKVLHRKRPGLIPLFDKAVLEIYRDVLSERGTTAWPQLVEVLRADLAANRDSLQQLSQALRADLPVPPTPLRIMDIAIWMSAHNRKAR